MKIAFLDHRDSFTYNVVALLAASLDHTETHIFSPDSAFNEIEDFSPTHIVIGPGPGSPQDYPLLKKVLAAFSHLPTLGVCLGMQAINEYYGGVTIPAPQPVHGKVHFVKHNGSAVFAGIPEVFPCMRYHSLQIKPANTVEILASAGGVPMALQVKGKSIYGLQFHPESFGSEYGSLLVRNILGRA